MTTEGTRMDLAVACEAAVMPPRTDEQPAKAPRGHHDHERPAEPDSEHCSRCGSSEPTAKLCDPFHAADEWLRRDKFSTVNPPVDREEWFTECYQIDSWCPDLGAWHASLRDGIEEIR